MQFETKGHKTESNQLTFTFANQTREEDIMAVSLSPVFFTISNSSSSLHLKINKKSYACLNHSEKPFYFNPLSSPSFLSTHQSFSRKLCRVHATILKENEEKVIVEETFQPKSFPDNKESSSNEDQPEGSSTSPLEAWAIKIEQTVNIALTDSVIQILDIFYRDRDYARFYVLETIARVPYFAFMSVLHMYESFGWWRRADYLKVHFAESWNEMHHLLIMEELGGNAWWFDRFLAQHIAVFYYFMTAFMYLLSPRMAYHFSECVESHAFSTYDKFIKQEGDKLKTLPAPEIAVKYYTEGDLYLFDEFQTARVPQSRRPTIENLYDVFMNIRDDEAEHCKTMKACQTHGNLRSPHSYVDDSVEEDSGCVVDQTDCIGIVDCVKKSVTVNTVQVKAK